MTILKGETYHVEAMDQFINRSHFDWYDVLEAIEQSSHFDIGDFAREANEIHDGDAEWEHIESVRDFPGWEGEQGMRAWEAQEMLSTHGISNGDPNVFIALFNQDDGDWVHLYDGVVHTIVEVYPDE
jgi:predicted aminopeptidase